MGLSTRLQDIRSGISNKISTVATNVSEKTAKLKNYVVSSLTISEKNREKIKKLAKKIIDFINENKSLVFFGVSVLFSYYMAPASSFEYLAKTGFSLSKTFVSGVLLGAGLLALKNILFNYPVKNAEEESKGKITKDDKINYLLGISNLCQIYLNPVLALTTSIGTLGFMTIKTAYRFLFPPDEIKKDPNIAFLVPKQLSDDVKTPKVNDCQMQADG
ncbi:MAG: hypothetical protein K1060chlam1_01263 [Candidatus Anoxychlamydiales bacterium]|nr:hypothetical protein [Candidatus Anoxychlamydiales bacterium]